jgi:hypothetical protein
MVALVFSLGLTLAMCAVIVAYGLRRPVGQYLTWGEAFVAGFWILGIMFLLYGIVPHQWLLFADNDLGWRSDKILFGPGDILDKALPFTMTYQVIRDLIATGIYAAGVVGQSMLWAWWQRRGKATAPKALPTSAYGRPLVKKV